MRLPIHEIDWLDDEVKAVGQKYPRAERLIRSLEVGKSGQLTTHNVRFVQKAVLEILGHTTLGGRAGHVLQKLMNLRLGLFEKERYQLFWKDLETGRLELFYCSGTGLWVGLKYTEKFLFALNWTEAQMKARARRYHKEYILRHWPNEPFRDDLVVLSDEESSALFFAYWAKEEESNDE